MGALAWATAPAGLSPVRWSQRLCAVRGFARHLHGLDPAAEVPPVDLLAYRRERPTPYLYTEHDIIRLVATATSLRPSLRAATYGTFFGLLAATGMRVGEAIHLDRGDVDLDAGVLDINDAKFRQTPKAAVASVYRGGPASVHRGSRPALAKRPGFASVLADHSRRGGRHAFRRPTHPGPDRASSEQG